MKSLFRGALIASLLAIPALANEPSTDLEKLSYSLGIVLNEIMTLRKPFENFPWDKVTKEGLEARI